LKSLRIYLGMGAVRSYSHSEYLEPFESVTTISRVSVLLARSLGYGPRVCDEGFRIVDADEFDNSNLDPPNVQRARCEHVVLVVYCDNIAVVGASGGLSVEAPPRFLRG
jgi:hypothetical protein